MAFYQGAIIGLAKYCMDRKGQLGILRVNVKLSLIDELLAIPGARKEMVASEKFLV